MLGICHGAHVTLDQFFAYHTQTIVTVQGLKNCFAVVAASFVRLVLCSSWCQLSDLLAHFSLVAAVLCSAVCLALFVERAKKCLDFGVTLYFIDFLVQCFYSVSGLGVEMRRGLMADVVFFVIAGVPQDVGLVAGSPRGGEYHDRAGRVSVLTA